MTKRRVAIWSISVAVLVALAVASGVLRLAAVFAVVMWQSLFPADVSWESHGAYVKCEGAIADPAQWPRPPAQACAAMNMCAAEAALSEKQRARLEEVMRKAGCR